LQKIDLRSRGASLLHQACGCWDLHEITHAGEGRQLGVYCTMLSDEVEGEWKSVQARNPAGKA